LRACSMFEVCLNLHGLMQYMTCSTAHFLCPQECLWSSRAELDEPWDEDACMLARERELTAEA